MLVSVRKKGHLGTEKIARHAGHVISGRGVSGGWRYHGVSIGGLARTRDGPRMATRHGGMLIPTAAMTARINPGNDLEPRSRSGPPSPFWERGCRVCPYTVSSGRAQCRHLQRAQRRSTVFLEARSMYVPDGPVELRPVGEVEFVQGLGGRECQWHLWPQPAAAASSPATERGTTWRRSWTVTGGEPQRFRASGIMSRGVPTHVDNGKARASRQRTFREGAKVLSSKGILSGYHDSFPQMPEVADFARACQMCPSSQHLAPSIG